MAAIGRARQARPERLWSIELLHAVEQHFLWDNGAAQISTGEHIKPPPRSAPAL
jgi:hypothetical protein